MGFGVASGIYGSRKEFRHKSIVGAAGVQSVLARALAATRITQKRGGASIILRVRLAALPVYITTSELRPASHRGYQ
jgi:hypothetical protein